MLTSALVLKVLGWVLPVILGPIVYVVAREVLNVARRVDDLPAVAKRIVVGIIGVVMTAAFTAAGVALPTECVASFAGSDFTEACATALTGKTTVQGVTAALAAMILHALKKSNPRA
jgi:ammonia channel protein AmtB